MGFSSIDTFQPSSASCENKTVDASVVRAAVGLDIGTTNVQAQLVNLETGESIDTFSAPNAQRVFGADVISRINAARNGKTKELFTVINSQVEVILRQFIEKWNLAKIEKCVVSGNMTMLHLFSGADPSAMGEAPYTPVFLEERHFTGKDFSLSADHINLLPGISAFVGADIVSGLAYVDIMNTGRDAFFVDIGTNGEMAVWNKSKKRLLCCATAAGPCFEEAEISCGLKAAELIDTIAKMKRTGVIDETGALADEFAQEGYPVVEGIVITQQDVRQFQLAKAAIFSGIKVLCRTEFSGIENVGAAYIAGGLGFFLNLQSAAEVGLLPKEFTSANTTVCGNTSLMGAVKSLLDTSFLPRCYEIIAHSTVIDLAVDKEFSEEFVENMMM
ncbi:MAG: ASKHA domain-containing protein [Treponema sp.]|nr:ASKHA domain-containing protein [Treponema sp.]